jgi:hypothetical protein
MSIMVVKPVIADFSDLGFCKATSKLRTSISCRDGLTILVTRQPGCKVALGGVAVAMHPHAAARTMVKPRPPLVRPSEYICITNKVGD